MDFGNANIGSLSAKAITGQGLAGTETTHDTHRSGVRQTRAVELYVCLGTNVLLHDKRLDGIEGMRFCWRSCKDHARARLRLT